MNKTTPKIKLSLLNSERARAIIFQVLFFVGLIALIVWIYDNTLQNMAARGITAGFDFLQNTAGFQILFSPFIDFQPSSGTYFDTFLIGIGNTMLITVLGIITATLLGFAVGISRLSSNWLLNKIALSYVEVFRNIPLLLQVMFWYFAILVPSLPLFDDSFSFFNESIIINKAGLQIPEPSASFTWAIALTVLIIANIAYVRIARKQAEQSGKQKPIFLISLAAWIGMFLLLQFLDPITLNYPVKERFAYDGGWILIPELLALWVALSIYTSAFIAEIVRAGIESVPKGQIEAAQSLNLSTGQALRLVTIPQALRLIIPPQTSQYLNLAKNSSLATAIGYPDLVALFAGTALNQVGKALEIISMTMLVYLSISLSISVLMNWYNHRIAITERK